MFQLPSTDDNVYNSFIYIEVQKPAQKNPYYKIGQDYARILPENRKSGCLLLELLGLWLKTNPLNKQPEEKGPPVSVVTFSNKE